MADNNKEKNLGSQKSSRQLSGQREDVADIGHEFMRLVDYLREAQDVYERLHENLPNPSVFIPLAITGGLVIMYLFWYTEGDLSNLPWTEQRGIDWTKIFSNWM
jgi:hypothetical protein